MATTFYKDIDISFDRLSTGDIPSVINLDAIKVSIYNTLFISNNENFFADDFGFNIRDLLFEHADELTELSLSNVIESAVENDERISEIEDLTIKFNNETKEYTINLKVLLRNLIEPQEIDLILKKTR